MTDKRRLRMANAERLNASASGNPRFRVTFTDGTVFETKRDAAINWGLENSENWGEADWEFERGFIIHVTPITMPVFVEEGTHNADIRRSYADNPDWHEMLMPVEVYNAGWNAIDRWVLTQLDQ